MRVFSWLFFPGAMHFLVFFLLCLSSRADLLVILQPPEVVCADASWSIHPGQWHVSEESIFLPAGSHRLQFASLPGWVAPSPWPLQLAVAGQNAVIIATYSKLVPADSIFHLQLTVTGSLSGRRHPLTMIVLENAAEGYDPQEDLADYIPVPDNWSTINLEREEREDESGLLWQTKSWRPECVWRLSGKLCRGDQLLLDWQQAVFPNEISAFLDGETLPDTIDLTAQTNCLLAGEGNFCLQLHVCHANVESIVYDFDPGWNTFGLVHQLLPGAEKALQAMKPLLWDAITHTFRQENRLTPNRAGWIFSQQKQCLQLLGMEMPASCTEIKDEPIGWQFVTATKMENLPPEMQAWTWEKGTFVPVSKVLCPGEAYWSWKDVKEKITQDEEKNP